MSRDAAVAFVESDEFSAMNDRRWELIQLTREGRTVEQETEFARLQV